MCIPFWKQVLSYILPIPLATARSEHNPRVKLRLVNGRLQLTTPKAIYSFDELYDNFYKAFRVTDLRNTPIEQVLLLGFGMGSIPYMLEKVFKKMYAYTAVEIDETIIDLARRYAIPRLKSSISLNTGDAAAFVAHSQHLFDLVCVDVFVDDEIPADIDGLTFLKNLQSRVSREGTIFFNRLYRSDEDKLDAHRYFQQVFLPVFPEAQALDVEGNLILVSNPVVLKPGAQDMVLVDF